MSFLCFLIFTRRVARTAKRFDTTDDAREFKRIQFSSDPET